MQLLQFLPFLKFLSQFLSELDENHIKIWINFKPTRLPSRFGPKPVRTGPRTAVFSGPCSDEMEGPGPRSSQDRSWSGPVHRSWSGPVHRSWSGPVHRSYVVLRTGPFSTIVNIPHMNRIFLGTQPGIGCRIKGLSMVLNFNVRERGGSPSEG